MKSLAKQLFEEYKIIIMKKALDMTLQPSYKVLAGASDNFGFLVDLEVLLCLHLQLLICCESVPVRVGIKVY